MRIENVPLRPVAARDQQPSTLTAAGWEQARGALEGWLALAVNVPEKLGRTKSV